MKKICFCKLLNCRMTRKRIENDYPLINNQITD